MQAKLLRAIESDRQLEEVLTDFWFNHFNVFVGKGQVRQYLTEYERDVIRPHVLGNFRDLLGATAHSPAMLFYLDNWQSSTPNAPPLLTPELQRRLNNPRVTPSQQQQLMSRLEQAKKQAPKGLNENYARELMELHTLGVDGGYTQKDVQEVARALTGWTIDRPQQGGGFVFRPQMHDTGEKTILGVSVQGRRRAGRGRARARHPREAPVDRASHRLRARAAVRRRRAARRRSSTAPRRCSSTPRAICARSCERSSRRPSSSPTTRIARR